MNFMLSDKREHANSLLNTLLVEYILLAYAIMQLPYSERSVFILHDIMGYDHRDIAHRLGYCVEVSKLRLHRARIRLCKNSPDMLSSPLSMELT